MQIDERSSKDVFLSSLFLMHYEQECIGRKRKKLLLGVKMVNATSVVTPTMALAIIGINPSCIGTILPMVGGINVIAAFLRYLPFYAKSAELLERSARIETLIFQMNLVWRMFKLELQDLAHFTEAHTLLFEEYGKTINSLTEEYKWTGKETNKCEIEAIRKLEQYLAYPHQIDDIFEKIADTKERPHAKEKNK